MWKTVLVVLESGLGLLESARTALRQGAKEERYVCFIIFTTHGKIYRDMHARHSPHSHSVLTLRSDAPRPPPVLSRVRENPAERQRDAESGVDAASRGGSVPREGP